MHIKGTVYVLLSALCYAFLSILAKFAYDLGFTTITLLQVEKLLASLVLWPFLYFTRPSQLALSRRQIRQLTVMALGGSVVGSLGFFGALQYLDASVATVLLFTNPAVVIALAAIFYREPLRALQLLALVACGVGSVLVVDLLGVGSLVLPPVGIALGLVASLGLGFLTFYSQKVLGGGLDPMVIMAYTNTLSGAVFFLLQPTALAGGSITGSMWALGLLLALFSSILPGILVLKGIALIGASRTALVGVVELPCNMFLAYFLLAERLTPLQLVGAALVLTGVVFVQLDKTPVAVKKENPVAVTSSPV